MFIENYIFQENGSAITEKVLWCWTVSFSLHLTTIDDFLAHLSRQAHKVSL